MKNALGRMHGLDMIASFLRTTSEGLGSSRDQLKHMRLAKDRPYMLDDEILTRAEKLYTEQNEHAPYYLNHCNHWRKSNLNELQKSQVDEIESTTKALKQANDEILSIVKYCKDFTIDRIMEKDDIELALEVLTGKIPFTKTNK